MRLDPDGSQLTQPNREPRIAIGVIYPTGSIYVTNKAALTNVPGNVVHGGLEDISAIGRELSPLDARSTIGSFSFSVVDVDGELTDELRAQLGAGEGVGRREVRVYTGDTDDFTDGTWARVDTFVVDSVVQFDRGSYRFSCSDRQRELRSQIFPAVSTRLVADLGVSDTSVTVSSTDGFDLVPHTAAFTDAPSTSVGYFRVKKTGEVIRFTGVATTPTRFTGCTRERFGTIAQAVDVDPTAEVDKQPEIELVYYLEMPAPQLAYALLTGDILETANSLPDGYHLGIDPSFVDDASFTDIGTDLYDPNDLTAGLVLLFGTHRGLRETDGKRFIEEQLLFPMWTFLQISNEGKFGLRRLVRLLGDAAPAAVVDFDTIMAHGSLDHQVGEVANRVIIHWNHDGDRFTRQSEFVNLSSISAHGVGRTLEFDLYGLTVSRHSKETVRRIFDAMTDRYGAPPQTMDFELSATLNQLEVGDVIRTQLAGVRDFAGAGSLDRSFELQSKSWNPRTGEVRVLGFASTARVDPDEQPAAPTPPLADAWYNSEGTALSSVLTIVGNAVTVNGNLAGNVDLRSGVYYHLGNLTINTGITVTVNENVQLRIRGTLTVNGTIDGIGRGINATADPNSVSSPLVAGFGLNVQTVGTTQGSAGIWYSTGSAEHLTFNSRPNTGTAALPRFNLGVLTGELTQIPAELRGTQGSWGMSVLEGGSLTVRALGGAGGDGGAGLMIVCRGLAFGASGEIDLSGGAGSAPAAPVTVGGRQLRGGAGGGGAPGGLLVALDGNDVALPDLADSFTADHGSTPQTGSPIQRAPPDQPAEPWTGFNPGISTLDKWQSSHLVQWVPQEVDAGDGDDEIVPAPTTLAIVASDLGAQLTWVSPPADKYDFIEVWRSTTNDRTGAVRIFRGKADAFFDGSPTVVTRYFWIRAGREKLGYSAWHPLGSTSGVSATYGGAIGLAPWTPILVNVTRNGSTFTKTGGAADTWDSSFYSQEGFNACGISWRASQTNLDLAVGLDSDPTSNHDLSAMDFAVHCQSNGDVDIYESNTLVGSNVTTYTTSDQFSVTYDGLRVRYYKNATLLRTSALIGARLFADSSFFDSAAAVNSVTFGPITHVLANAVGWAADSQGKPAGMRQVQAASGGVDYTRISIENGAVKLTVTGTSDGSGWGAAAIPVGGSTKTYQITLRHRSSGSSADGNYLRMWELNGALGAGKTHVGAGAVNLADTSVCAEPTGFTDLISNAAMPGTTTVEQTFTYTPPSGTNFVTLSLYNWQPNTDVDYFVEWVAMTELGSNVDLLPGVLPPVDTFSINAEAATEVGAISDNSQAFNPSLGGPANTRFNVAIITIDAEPQDVIELTASFDRVSGNVSGAGDIDLFHLVHADDSGTSTDSRYMLFMNANGPTFLREGGTLIGTFTGFSGTTNLRLQVDVTVASGATLNNLTYTDIELRVTKVKR